MSSAPASVGASLHLQSSSWQPLCSSLPHAASTSPHAILVWPAGPRAPLRTAGHWGIRDHGRVLSADTRTFLEPTWRHGITCYACRASDTVSKSSAFCWGRLGSGDFKEWRTTTHLPIYRAWRTTTRPPIYRAELEKYGGGCGHPGFLHSNYLDIYDVHTTM